MALGIVKYFYDPLSANRGQLVHGQFVVVSCRGPKKMDAIDLA